MISAQEWMSFPDTPVFTPEESEDIRTNQYTRPYAAITKSEFVGLLHALGEYAMRISLGRLLLIQMAPDDSDLLEWNDALIGCWRQLRKIDLSCIASRDEFAFDVQERRKLSTMKYVRGCEHLNKPETIGVLEALGRYSVRAPKLQQVFGRLTGHLRVIHAHNALVAFRDQPFTFPDYVRSLHAATKTPADLNQRVSSADHSPSATLQAGPDSDPRHRPF